MEHPSRPVVWSIAGSDSGAGAGIQADLRAFDTFDVHGCTAVAAITAQNSVRVLHVEPVVTDLLDAQLAALADDLPPCAIKTGLLGSVENVHCVARWVDRLRRLHPVALVVDPVWRASTGADLSSAALRKAILAELLPRATVVTPNRAEAAWLLDWDATALSAPSSVARAATALRGWGPKAVVITGGDAGGHLSLDYLDAPEANGWLILPRIETTHDHGSGCVFAASLAAALALGFCASDATVIAKMSATNALARAREGGRGAGAVRPRRGFGLIPKLLPSLHSAPQCPSLAFPALADRNLGLYAVVDSADWVERVLNAGVRTVQLRIKDGTRQTLSREAARAIQAARSVQAQLFINDHWKLAIEHGAYGVHLGQEDLPAADMDAIRDAGLRLGLSTHSYWEVCRAHGWMPSYIACGPIHATTTKEMPWWPQGADNLAYWCGVLREPVVAIAGMDAERSAQAIRCGAAGVAVLRGIAQADYPERTIQSLQAAIAQASLAARFQQPELPRSTYPGPVMPPAKSDQL
jgi:hydroxymethylpyrimidine kinase/phosphomethylpyrimidine kinase/thiamine-phosphate diphosphorylase